MNYDEVLEYIHEKEDRGIVPGLDNIEKLLSLLQNPEQRLPAIHIAGTNGKGSIMAYVETVLRLLGLKTGRYISPAIFDYRDRWIIDGNIPSREYVADVFTRLAPFVTEAESILPPGPTSFEIETAAAFMMYEDSGCDVNLIECGMGGRLDATNVFISTPVVVLAKISMDHMQFLGDTVFDIAREKLGIVKEGDTVVSYPQDAEVMDFIRRYLNENFENVKLIEVDTSELEIVKEDLNGSSFIYKGVKYGIGLLGRHQIYNAITAVETVNAFVHFINSMNNDIMYVEEAETGAGVTGVNGSEWSFGKGYSDCVRKTDMCLDGLTRFIVAGLAKTVWKGRLEKINDAPPFYIDGAHNTDAWLTLADNLERYFTDKRKVFIIGVLKDKEYQQMVDILAPYMDYAVTVTTVNNKRALSGNILAELIREKGVSAESAADYEGAVKRAVEMADKNSVIIACGSLSFTGDITMVVKKHS